MPVDECDNTDLLVAGCGDDDITSMQITMGERDRSVIWQFVAQRVQRQAFPAFWTGLRHIGQEVEKFGNRRERPSCRTASAGEQHVEKRLPADMSCVVQYAYSQLFFSYSPTNVSSGLCRRVHSERTIAPSCTEMLLFSSEESVGYRSSKVIPWMSSM